jgi:hypothetical protein
VLCGGTQPFDPGHKSTRAELGVPLSRITALGDSCSAKPIDIAFEDRVVIIGEQVTATVIGVMQRSDKERSHLTVTAAPAQ